MKKSIISFFLYLSLLLILSFCVHLFILFTLKFSLFDNKIILAYTLNYAVAAFVFLLLYFAKNKYAESLGFLFMIGSLLKFGIYFMFFNADYKIDNKTDKIEFFTFFVPYAVSLIVEIRMLIVLLNKTESISKK